MQSSIEDVKRSCELAVYFSHCKLQAGHVMLTLKTATRAFFKLENKKTCAVLCRRLLEMGPRADVSTQIRKLLAACEQDPTDKHQLNYDALNPFNVCAISYVPIYRGNAVIQCPFCAASFLPEHKGKLCPICQVCNNNNNTK